MGKTINRNIAVNPESVISNFKIDQPVERIIRWGDGHIHDTYRVETIGHRPDFILQKINGNVFRDIPGMMQNIGAVCTHLRNKLSLLPGHDPDRESLTLILTRQHQTWYEDEWGNSWRVYVFIPDTVTHQKMSDPAMASEAGRAIGSFQSMLADLQEPLVETIPGFHNIDLRISQFDRAKSQDLKQRAASVTDEIRFAEEWFGSMRKYYEKLQKNAVLRATHNDTKINNVLFDRHNKALCLIDLDTVMPGYAHFDYGDALRTMASTAPEDERNLSKVNFNISVYENFTKGYLSEAGNFLSPGEIPLLPFAPVFLTFIIGLRFLTDFLNSDVYFRIHHPDHNLVRARVQFRLVSEMERYLPGL